MDAGPVWATETFADARGHQVEPVPQRGHRGRDAVRAVLRARAALRGRRRAARAASPAARRHRARRSLAAADARRPTARIDWQRDDTQTVLRKIRAADGAPGVLDRLFGAPCHLFDAHAEPLAQRASTPGQRDRPARTSALLRATRRRRGVDRARAPRRPGRRLQAARGAGLPAEAAALPERPIAPDAPADAAGWREIRYEARRRGRPICTFDFYNGAMSTGAVRAPDRGRARRAGAAHPGAGAAGRSRLLEQRHPPERDRGGATARPTSRGATSTR